MSMTIKIVHEPEISVPHTTNTNDLILDDFAIIDSDISFFIIEE